MSKLFSFLMYLEHIIYKISSIAYFVKIQVPDNHSLKMCLKSVKILRCCLTLNSVLKHQRETGLSRIMLIRALSAQVTLMSERLVEAEAVNTNNAQYLHQCQLELNNLNVSIGDESLTGVISELLSKMGVTAIPYDFNKCTFTRMRKIVVIAYLLS